MAWRVAKSLQVLLQQCNAAAPSRSKRTDGTRASDEHRARSPNSDHNEKYINGEWVVCAMDITHDPDDGLDCQKLFDELIESRDERIKYLIWNRQISNPSVQDWKKRPAADHEGHLHISVHDDPALFDDTRPWDIFDKQDIDREPVGPRFKDIVTTAFGGPDDKLSSGKGAYGILDYRKPQVALPYNFRAHKEPVPKVRLFYGGKSVIADVADVGPWNINDPYWKTGKRPQAESGYDLGQTRYGVRKTNLAGIDITQTAADMLGLPGTGVMRKAKIDWEFVDAKLPDTPPPIKPNPPTDPPDPPVITDPPVIIPPSLPSNDVDWNIVIRQNWAEFDSWLEQGEMFIRRARDVTKAINSGRTAGEIVQERKMSNTPAVGTKVEAVTKSAVSMKSNWAFFVMIAAQLINYFSKGKINIDENTQEMIITMITTLAGGLGVYWRSNASSITPTGAAKLENKLRSGAL